MPDMSIKYKGNEEYFGNLLNHLTPESANHFFSYLLLYNGLKITDEKLIPESETKSTMTKRSLHVVEIFFDEIETEEWDPITDIAENQVSSINIVKSTSKKPELINEETVKR